MVLPPVQCGQVGTQPCAKVVEEDHVEWDAHQGIEDTKDLPCLRTGCQVSVAYRARECIDQGKRELRTTSHLPAPGPAEACPHHLWGKRCSLFPWILTDSLIEQSLLIEDSSPVLLPPSIKPS